MCFKFQALIMAFTKQVKVENLTIVFFAFAILFLTDKPTSMFL